MPEMKIEKKVQEMKVTKAVTFPETGRIAQGLVGQPPYANVTTANSTFKQLETTGTYCSSLYWKDLRGTNTHTTCQPWTFQIFSNWTKIHIMSKPKTANSIKH